MILFLLFNDCCATIVFAAVIVRQIIDIGFGIWILILLVIVIIIMAVTVTHIDIVTPLEMVVTANRKPETFSLIHLSVISQVTPSLLGV